MTELNILIHDFLPYISRFLIYIRWVIIDWYVWIFATKKYRHIEWISKWSIFSIASDIRQSWIIFSQQFTVILMCLCECEWFVMRSVSCVCCMNEYVIQAEVVIFSNNHIYANNHWLLNAYCSQWIAACDLYSRNYIPLLIAQKRASKNHPQRFRPASTWTMSPNKVSANIGRTPPAAADSPSPPSNSLRTRSDKQKIWHHSL